MIRKHGRDILPERSLGGDKESQILYLKSFRDGLQVTAFLLLLLFLFFVCACVCVSLLACLNRNWYADILSKCAATVASSAPLMLLLEQTHFSLSSHSFFFFFLFSDSFQYVYVVLVISLKVSACDLKREIYFGILWKIMFSTFPIFAAYCWKYMCRRFPEIRANFRWRKVCLHFKRGLGYLKSVWFTYYNLIEKHNLDQK